MVTLVVILIMLIIVSTDGFKHSVFGQNSDFEIDQCGHVNTISTYAAVLMAFYYFPLVILITLIIKKIGNRILTIRNKSHQHVINATSNVREPPQGDLVNTASGGTVMFTEVCVYNDDNCMVYHSTTTLN